MTPTIVSYVITNKELAQMLVKELGCEEGHWELGFSFTLTVNHLLLQKVGTATEQSVEVRPVDWPGEIEGKEDTE